VSTWDGSKLAVRISSAAGDTSIIPAKRNYRILFRGVGLPTAVEANIDGAAVETGFSYDVAARTVLVDAISLGINQTLRVTVEGMALLDKKVELRAAVLRILNRARMETDTKWQINERLDQLLDDVELLNDPNLKLTPVHLLALKETIAGR